MPLRACVRVITLVAAGAILLPPAFGQSKGGSTAPPRGGTTGGTGAGTTGGSRTPTPTSQNPPPNQPQSTSITQPIFISGRVMLEDGTVPTGQVVIERVCNGNPHAEGYADSRGYFSIDLTNRNTAVMQEASDMGGGLGMGGFGGLSQQSAASSGAMGSAMNTDMRLINCEIRARVGGFRSQSVSLANHRALDNPDIGVILLHRIAASEGSTISASSLAAPKDARKAFEKGTDALRKKKFEEAEKSFQKAVDAYPGYASAWFELGRLQAHDGHADDARKSFEAAVKADPKFVSPYMEITVMEVRAQRWKEVAEMSDKVVSLDPFDYPQAYFLNAVANYNVQNLAAAERSAREAERLDTRHDFPKSSQLLGLILAQRHDFTGAAEQFRTYLKLAPTATDADTVRKQLDEVEKVSAQTALPAKQDQQ